MSVAADQPVRRVSRRLVIRASAGSGKTYRLSGRYLQLLLTGVPPEQILATTFTRKAAGEILRRILRRLADAALEKKSLAALQESIDDPTLKKARCEQTLADLTRSLHRLQVGTLDSFFARVGIHFSLELGLGLGWALSEGDALDDLKNRAVRRLLAEGERQDLTSLLHLLAKGETQRSVRNLVDSAVEERLELYRDANAEAWRRLKPLPSLTSEELDRALLALESYPATGKRLASAIEADVCAVREGLGAECLKKGLLKVLAAGGNTYYGSALPDDLVELYRPVLKHVRAEAINPVIWQIHATFDLLERFAGQYDPLQRQEGRYGFSDLVRRIGAWATEDRTDGLAWRMDARVDHLLLDEFQDTSWHQWRALESFAERIFSETGDRTFFCVGDVKQAIYGWRGGDSAIFDRIVTRYSAEETTLEQSYRSAPPIMEAVNRVFSGAVDRVESPGAVAWLKSQFRPHTTAKSGLAGYVELIEAAGEEGEAKQAACLRAAAAIAARLTKERPDLSIGVLTRSNRTVSTIIGMLRQVHGVAASEEGGVALDDSPAADLILSALKLADHPQHTAAGFHVANSCLGEHLGFHDARDGAAAAKLSWSIRETIAREGFGAATARLAEPLVGHCGPRDVTRLRQLVELAYAYRPTDLRADSFLRWLESRRVGDPTADRLRVMTIHQSKGLEFDAVILPELSGYWATGLAGFYADRDGDGVATGVYRYLNSDLVSAAPEFVREGQRRYIDKQTIERLCMLYVAMTRAIHALYMVIPPGPKTAKECAGCSSDLLRMTLAGKSSEEGVEAEEEIATVEIEGESASTKSLFQLGDEDWLCRVELHESDVLAAREERRPARTSPVVAAPEKGRNRMRTRKRPSSSLGFDPFAREGDAASFDGRERGRFLHACLECVEWLPDGGAFDDGQVEAIVAKALRRLRWSSLPSACRSEDFAQSCSGTILRSLLGRDGYLADAARRHAENLRFVAACQEADRLEAENERQIAASVAGETILGRLDRVVWLYAGDRLLGAEIVDWKTDAFADDRTHERMAQVADYRSAIVSSSGLAEAAVVASLVFVTRGEIQVLGSGGVEVL